jgi:hypothetical protein
LEGLAMEYVGILCGHGAYFMAIWYILLPFDIFLVYFSGFGTCTKINLATLAERERGSVYLL